MKPSRGWPEASQVARALGAEVFAAAGSEAKLDLCRELGAAEAYLYDAIPDDLRVDVVVDPVQPRIGGAIRSPGQAIDMPVVGGPTARRPPAASSR